MINKEFDLITKTDIEELVSNQVKERKTLEYKRQLPVEEKSKLNILANVCSLANTSGGDIIFGVEDVKDSDNVSTGMPLIITLKNINADSAIQSLENSIRDSIEPRLHIKIKEINGFTEGTLIILRVEKSWNSPHRIKQNSKFYGRNNIGKYELDYNEIKWAFLNSESLTDKIRSFRSDRIIKITANEGIIRLLDDPKVIVHLFPLASFSSGFSINFRKISKNRYPMLIGGNGWNPKFNFDGFANYYDDFGYTQVFRNGIIEAVYIIGGRRDENLIHDYATHVIEAIKQYLKFLIDLEISMPIVVGITYANVLGKKLETRSIWSNPQDIIDRNILIVPEVIIDGNKEVEYSLQPVFDSVWQASGHDGSPNYDEDGNFLGR